MAKKTKKAKSKVAKNKVAKKSKKKSKKKMSAGRPVGKITEVGVKATWILAFAENERVSKAKRQDDAGISRFMKKNFPGRTSEVFDQVQLVRNRYNVNGLMEGGSAPKIQSNRYDSDGELLTARGKLASEVESKISKKKTSKKKTSKKKTSKKKTSKKVKVKRSKK